MHTTVKVSWKTYLNIRNGCATGGNSRAAAGIAAAHSKGCSPPSVNVVTKKRTIDPSFGKGESSSGQQRRAAGGYPAHEPPRHAATGRVPGSAPNHDNPSLFPTGDEFGLFFLFLKEQSSLCTTAESLKKQILSIGMYKWLRSLLRFPLSSFTMIPDEMRF